MLTGACIRRATQNTSIYRGHSVSHRRSETERRRAGNRRDPSELFDDLGDLTAADRNMDDLSFAKTPTVPEAAAQEAMEGGQGGLDRR